MSTDIPEAVEGSEVEEVFIHPNLKLLSNSSNQILHGCPRRYELYKTGQFQDVMWVEQQVGDFHLDFGSIVGLGTQEIIKGGDRLDSINAAYMQMLINWPNDLDDYEGLEKKKTFWYSLLAVDKFSTLWHTALGAYEVAMFDGKPAVELGCTIDLGNGFVYRCFLDALLINRMTKELIVYEGKTTGMTMINEATYKNSSQGLGYSLVVDAIAKLLGQELESSFTVLYCIYSSSRKEWELMQFKKNHTQRAMWIRNLLLDQRDVMLYAEIGQFPMRGEFCYSFFRQCEFFDLCEMDNKILVGDIHKVPVKKDDPSKYQFHFSIEELIEAQLERSSSS